MANVLVDASGEELPGIFIGARHESVVLLHDIFGLTNQIRGIGRRLAAEGFSVFAPDLFDGKTAKDETKGGQLVQAASWKVTIERVRQAVTALAQQGHGAGVAAVGIGFGGAVSLAAGAHIPSLAACVTFYGIPTVDRGDLLNIKGKVQGHFGNQDKKFTRDRVDQLEAKLQGAGIATELHRYHAVHFFFDETNKNTHSAHNSELAFRRTVGFLKKALGGGW